MTQNALGVELMELDLDLGFRECVKIFIHTASYHLCSCTTSVYYCCVCFYPILLSIHVRLCGCVYVYVYG